MVGKTVTRSTMPWRRQALGVPRKFQRLRAFKRAER